MLVDAKEDLERRDRVRSVQSSSGGMEAIAFDADRMTEQERKARVG